MTSSLQKNGDLSDDEIRKIAENLKKRDIKTPVDRLINELPNLIPNSRLARRFKKDIGHP